MASVEKKLNKEIQHLIVQHLKSGQKLPTEKELMERYGVSRTALRDVFAMYEAQGVIESTQGRGRIAKMPDLTQQVINTWGIALELNPELLFDILELRTIVEMSVLPRGAQRMDTDQLQYMGMLVESMKAKAKMGDVFAEEDRAFHMTIFKNVGNTLTEQLLTALWTLLNSQIATRHPDLEAVAAQHEDILRALVRKDLDALQKSTSEQLADVRYRIMMGMLQNAGKSAGSIAANE